MKRAFADTSFYVAVLNSDDARHVSATAWSQDASLIVVTTEFVLVELGNFLCDGPGRDLLEGLVRYLRSNPRTTVLPVSTALFDAGLDLYSGRPDKSWSFTDCISFVVMKEQDLSEALSTDHHFEQAGFKALLK